VIELVINAPHLQTWKQRLSAIVLNVLGWLLWCYLFFPLLSLTCWFLDYQQCSQWVDLSGGYRSVREMLLIYLGTIAGMIWLWLAWVAYNIVKRKRRQVTAPIPTVSLEELCNTFNVLDKELRDCQESRFAVVHFDQSGHIIGLERGADKDAGAPS
jgi:poly-beta-1,6-N-acetyl-D-glucosamine biosynthesis protein PgaD